MPATTTKKSSKSTAEVDMPLPKNFEQAYAELESIVAQMESGQMQLEASLTAYTRGNFLLQFCQKSLADVEQQVQILNDKNQLVAFKPEHD
ncbi:MAG: exodeoxyribonuclease VII small subunit [Betaproteobacteria bacterium]